MALLEAYKADPEVVWREITGGRASSVPYGVVVGALEAYGQKIAEPERSAWELMRAPLATDDDYRRAVHAYLKDCNAAFNCDRDDVGDVCVLALEAMRVNGAPANSTTELVEATGSRSIGCYTVRTHAGYWVRSELRAAPPTLEERLKELRAKTAN